MLGRDLDGSEDFEEIGAGVAGYAPAIEVVNSRFHDYKFHWLDNVADNSSSAGFAVGPWRQGCDVAAIKARLLIDGELVDEGESSAVMGHPLAALAEGARIAASLGQRLKAGMVILTGGITRAHPIAPGQTADSRIRQPGERQPAGALNPVSVPSPRSPGERWAPRACAGEGPKCRQKKAAPKDRPFPQLVQNLKLSPEAAAATSAAKSDFLLLDAFAERVAHKTLQRHRRADGLVGFLHGLADGLAAVVVDIGLLEQADFLEIGLQAGLRRSFPAHAPACRRSFRAARSSRAPAPPGRCRRSRAPADRRRRHAWRSCGRARSAPTLSPVDSSATMTPILPRPSPIELCTYWPMTPAGHASAAARRRVMFSPMVAMALAMASATEPSPPG